MDRGLFHYAISPPMWNKYWLKIYKLSYPISVYNINSMPNKNGQINKVVDIVLYYKTYLEQILLIVLSLSKQDLRLGFILIKQYNPKVDWQKEEIVITRCLVCCSLIVKTSTRLKNTGFMS